MASPTNPLAALMPQPYLDFAASPLGPALRRQPLVSVGIAEQGLDTLVLDVEVAGPVRHVRGTHPSGLELTVDVEPDPAHQALVWHLGLAQGEGGPGPRLHDLHPLEITLAGALAPDPAIHTWLGGTMQPFFPPDAFAQGPGGRLYKASYPPAAVELGRFGPGQWVYRTRVIIDGYVTDSVEADTLTITPGEYRGRAVWQIANRWGWKYFAARDTLLVDRQDLRPVRRAHPAPRVQRPGTTPPGIDFPPDTGLGPLLLARVPSTYPGTPLSWQVYPALGLLNFVYAKPVLLLLPFESNWRGSLYLTFGWGQHQFGAIPLDVRVVGRETVHIPAGTFDCWRVELSVPSSRRKTTIWVSRERGWLVQLREPMHDGAQEQVLVSTTPPAP